MEMTEKNHRAIENSKTDQLDLDLKDKSEKLLEVKNLKTYFYTEEGIVKAVDGVSFDMYSDETLGLVGETGCGKSVTALSILRLVREPGKIIEGSIIFNGKNLLELTEHDMRDKRGNEITMIFQDPLNSLNPVISVGRQISEVFLLHQDERLKKIRDNRQLERKKLIEERKNLKKELATKEKNGLLTEEEKKRIFQPYYRSDDAGKRERYPGLGLGLSISKKIVELHQGDIWVNGKPGKGNTFGFSLPVDLENERI